MALALECARHFRGATQPNPPVGAVALDVNGEVLSVQAHERAGTAHAEAKVLRDLEERGLLDRLHTLVVTLEPCNHYGRTPPCTEAILRTPVKRVVFGARDPNPRVKGSGAEKLKEAGIEVISGVRQAECEELIEGFAHWITTGLPFVTVKSAIHAQGSMIPPPGQKTFTSELSLRLAHEIRKQSDAILTGSGTVLADDPEFTVRRVPDHPAKTRWLVLMDRRRRVPPEWIQKAESRGFAVAFQTDITQAFEFLGRHGCLEVLVEAGPDLTNSVLSSSLWNRHIQIFSEGSGHDRIEITKNVHWHYPKAGTGHEQRKRPEQPAEQFSRSPSH